MKNIFSILYFALFFITISGSAQTIFTDRPNVTDAVDPIPAGRFQTEVGFLFSEEDMTGIKSMQIPNLSFKYGIVDWFEMRLITSYNRLSDLPLSEDESGLSPITFSPKIGLTEQNGVVPNTALVANFTFQNLASEAFDVSEFQGGLTGLFEYNFGKVTWTNSIGRLYTCDCDWAYTTVVGTSFTDKIGGFVEFYGTLNNNSTLNYDVGITYIITDNLQADALYGNTFEEFGFYFFGFGIAWKTDFK